MSGQNGLAGVPSTTAAVRALFTEGEVSFLYDANGLPVVLNGDGGIPVHLINGGSGGTSSVDESGFIAGSSIGTPLMGVVNPVDTPPNGDLAIAALDSSRRLQIAGSFSSTPATSNTITAAAQTVIGTTAAQILAANGSRKGFLVQNLGTTVIKIVLGAGTPTQTVYHYSLPACGNANDGSSPLWNGPVGLIWTGAVQAISSASGGLVSVSELT